MCFTRRTRERETSSQWTAIIRMQLSTQLMLTYLSFQIHPQVASARHGNRKKNRLGILLRACTSLKRKSLPKSFNPWCRVSTVTLFWKAVSPTTLTMTYRVHPIANRREKSGLYSGGNSAPGRVSNRPSAFTRMHPESRGGRKKQLSNEIPSWCQRFKTDQKS